MAQITEQQWGSVDGQAASLFTLKAANGVEVQVSNYGGHIVRMMTPDRDGSLVDIVLGLDDAESYSKPNPYFGALVGRYANRIAGAHFTLGGKEYQLAKNDGPNSLHGGAKGFDKRFWAASTSSDGNAAVLTLKYTSPDGEEGYPGKLDVQASYTLIDDGQLILSYVATTDQETIINLTDHSYFNLAGSGDILDHELTIAGDYYLPTDDTLIPTGELRPVEGTPFDFRKAAVIGSRIRDNDDQLVLHKGYDHNFVLRREPSHQPEFAARLHHPKSGRVVEIHTTEPGVQLYTSSMMDEGTQGKGGNTHGQYSAACLETQHWPDSPNHPEFPSVVLRIGDTFRSTTILKFSVQQ